MNALYELFTIINDDLANSDNSDNQVFVESIIDLNMENFEYLEQQAENLGYSDAEIEEFRQYLIALEN